MAERFKRFIGDVDELITERTPELQATERGVIAFNIGVPRSASQDEPEELRDDWLYGWDLAKEI